MIQARRPGAGEGGIPELRALAENHQSLSLDPAIDQIATRGNCRLGGVRRGGAVKKSEFSFSIRGRAA